MAKQETGISKARARELFEQARMDVARAQSLALESIQILNTVMSITGEAWAGLELGEDVPEYEVTVRMRNVG